MKILLATFLYEKEIGGGVVAVVHSLAYSLIERGMKVAIVTTSDVKRVQIEREENLVIYRLPPYNLYWVGHKNIQPAWKKLLWHVADLWNPYMYGQMRSIIASEKPDIVHVHKMRGLSPAIWLSARREGTRRVIHTCHDYELLSPEGTFSGSIGRLAYASEKAILPYTFPRARLSRQVHAVTAPSHYTLDLHVKRGFFSQASQHVVPNSHGFTLKQLQSREIPEKEFSDTINFLFIGRLEKIKGLEILCKAFEKATACGAQLHLKIAGYGSLTEEIQKKYQDFPGIELCGPAFGGAKERLFNESDVVIFPSNSPETFGITIAEAYAYGKPVIASSVGGVPEIVVEGETGFLVPPGDINALADKMEEISRNPSCLQKMGNHCLTMAQRFTLEEVLDQYLFVYGEGK